MQEKFFQNLKHKNKEEQYKELFKFYELDELDFKLLYDLDIKLDEFMQAFAKAKNLEFITFECVNEKLMQILPFNLADENNFLPFKEDEANIYIAFCKPCNLDLLEKISNFFKNKFIKIFLANPIKIQRELKKWRIKEELKTLSLKLKEEFKAKIKQEEQASVVSIFKLIIEEALKTRSSDIHIEPSEEQGIIRFRIDGILSIFCNLDKQSYEALIFYIKLLAHLDVAQSRKAQDGSFSLDFLGQKCDFRVSTLPLIYAESVVIRILRRDKSFLELENLKFTDKNLALLKKQIKSAYGMILLTGPTGSGKSTTLYACLNELKSTEKKIISAEDPIEYRLDLVQQILLNPKAGLDFSNALRAILRQDPDVIMVGEIRDEQSLDIAIKAALTGHLLLSTLHTNDAISSLYRLIDMKAKPYLLSSALNLIIAQRLFRKLCPFCKQKDENIYEEFGKGFYKAKGCEHCNYTGFLGRALLEEFLLIDEELATLIRLNANKQEFLEQARKKGFETMLELGIKKAKMGLTSIEELLRVLR